MFRFFRQRRARRILNHALAHVRLRYVFGVPPSSADWNAIQILTELRIKIEERQ